MDLKSELLLKISHSLSASGFPVKLLQNNEVRFNTIVYMLYWYDRLAVKPDEQQKVYKGFADYLVYKGFEGGQLSKTAVVDSLLQITNIKRDVQEYVERWLHPVPTIDLVCIQESKILCINRDFYPEGVALIGGIIRDYDESNKLGVSSQLFAALHVAGEKILKTSNPIYSRDVDVHGNEVFAVSVPDGSLKVKIYPHDRYGYAFRENLKTVLRPSDKRHIVNTVGFKCFVEGTIVAKDLVWKEKEELLSEVVFEHHREIISHVTAQSSLEQELLLQEKDFIRSIIERPLETYQKLNKRFAQNKYDVNVSFPELFPTVDRLLREMYSPEINDLCKGNVLLVGIRDKATISLRHVSLKNRVLCPYLPTVRAIFESIAFFDIVARTRRGFYDLQPTDRIIEHNPKEVAGASYHMYRYKYRLDAMLAMVPNEILIPTFEDLSVDDLMKVRGVPLRFIGLATDFLYVDEFEQSPEEFLMHDCNHSYRMIQEDLDELKRLGISRDRFFKRQCRFIDEYLGMIRIRETDSEEEREIKKVKKLILFEIVHEDARPFLKEVIGRYIQSKEGGSVPFEVPHIDPKTGYMDVVDTLDTGISTLSYVRNKLQHSFYDRVDTQHPQIVKPEYRKVKYIAQAAYDMLVELKIRPVKDADRDRKGRVSYEWLMRRASSVGPDNIHAALEEDEDLVKFGDGIEKLNPKRYQA